MKREDLKALLNRFGIRLKKSSGQNFLVEENLLDAIARDGQVEPEDVVLEIGTGVGVLTERLVKMAHHVVSVEVDAGVLRVARERLAAHENLTFLHADALETKNALNPDLLDLLESLTTGERDLRVVANLPYHIATSLVVLLLSSERLTTLRSVVVLVQQEAGERFAARRGEPKYGGVSILCQRLTEEVCVVRRVPRDVFHPRPKVTSSVVRLVPRPDRLEGFEALSQVVRALFNYRRKTIGSASKQVARRDPMMMWLRDGCAEAGIDLSLRPEQLELEDFVRIAARRPSAPHPASHEAEPGQKALENKEL